MIDKIGNSYIFYNKNHDISIREYYLYNVNLIKNVLKELDCSINIVLGGYHTNFNNNNKTYRIDIQFEHTLVKEGGRSVTDIIRGDIFVPNSDDKYLIRIDKYDYYRSLDLVIEYSEPNIKNISTSPQFEQYIENVIYIAPFIYKPEFPENRQNDSITLIGDINQERRKMFLNNIKNTDLNFKNIRDVFDKTELQKIYQNTKVLINIHQTDHHHTFEELRVLPALLCGTIILSEDVPLKEHIPYSEFIVWSDYSGIIYNLRKIINNYDEYFNVFKKSETFDKFLKIEQDNYDNMKKAITKLWKKH